MAASAPSFSSCDVVPQQCYRRTAEESPAVSAPRATFTAQLYFPHTADLRIHTPQDTWLTYFITPALFHQL